MRLAKRCFSAIAQGASGEPGWSDNSTTAYTRNSGMVKCTSPVSRTSPTTSIGFFFSGVKKRMPFSLLPAGMGTVHRNPPTLIWPRPTGFWVTQRSIKRAMTCRKGRRNSPHRPPSESLPAAPPPGMRCICILSSKRMALSSSHQRIQPENTDSWRGRPCLSGNPNSLL